MTAEKPLRHPRTKQILVGGFDPRGLVRWPVGLRNQLAKRT